MKLHPFSLLLLVFFFLASACGQAETTAEFPVATDNSAATVAPTATAPSPTPTPYPPAEPISLSNASELTEVLSIGRGSFQGMILSPDKTEVLIATSLGFYICDAHTLEVKDIIQLEGGFSGSVAWSPDGQYLAFRAVTDEFQQELFIYDFGTKEFSSLYRPPFNWELWGFSWNKDSSSIGFRSEDWNRVGQTSLMIVELIDGSVTLNAPVSGWTSVPAWAPDGQRFAISMGSNPNITSERSSEIQIWGPDRVNPFLSIPTAAGGILEWSNDGGKLSLQAGGWFYIYDAATGDELLQVDTGGKIDYGTEYRNLHEWTNSDEDIQFLDPVGDLWQLDIATESIERLVERGLDENVFALSLESPVVYTKENGFLWKWFNSSGEVTSTEIRDWNLKSIELENGEVAGRFTPLSASASYAYLDRDQRILCTVKDYIDYRDNFQGSITRFWNLPGGEELYTDNIQECSVPVGVEGNEQPSWSGSVGPASRAGDNDGTYHEGETWLSPDGTTKLEIGPNGSILVKDAGADELAQTLTGTGFGISVLAGSPNGEYVAVAYKDWTVRIYRVEDGELLANVGGVDRQLPIGWSPDSKKIQFVNFSYENQIGVFDVSTGVRINLAIQHLDPYGMDAIQLLSWSPDGDMILAATAYGIELFDATTGEVLKHLSDDVVDFYSLGDDFTISWLENGAWIFVSHYDGTLSLWGLEQP